MNILHLSAQKPDSTGSGVYLAQTVAGFARTGHKQAVIAGINADDAPTLPEGVAFYPIRFETDALPFPVVGMSNVMPYRATRYCDLTPEATDQFKAAFEAVVGKALDEFVPDLVVCHHLYLACAVAVNVLRQRQTVDPRLASCAIKAVCHSTDINQMRQIPLERCYISKAMRQLDEALALHGPQAAEIAEVYGIDQARIRVIGTGYDAALFHAEHDMRTPGARRLLYVGKIWERKGVASLLRAIASLPPEDAPAETVLIGGHSEEDEYDRLVALARECPYPVHLAGVVSQDHLIENYNRANVFVLPSFYEGLPLVIVEAMACGCNVVATDLPGIQEWITSQLPTAPISFVAPPAMLDADTPDPEALPAFEADLAAALAQALSAPVPACDTTPVSWDAVCRRMLGA